MLAGVGTTWYTWLEQGREVNPSNEVLVSIAATLRLGSVERAHLHRLYDRSLPASPLLEPEEVGPSLRRTLDGMTDQPAFVLGRRWDILAWNRAADAVFGPYERLTGDARNALHMAFADMEHRRRIVDWESMARSTLAMFRADSVRYAGDPDFERLIALLSRSSAEFAAWWTAFEVEQPVKGYKRIRHPVMGERCYEYASFSVDGTTGSLAASVRTPRRRRTRRRLPRRAVRSTTA